MKVPLPASALQVACGDNHTVVLLTDHQVYTFGKFQEGQLGRRKEDGDDNNWHMIPRSVSGFDGRCKATWVGAQANQTFIAVDESLVSETSLSRCTVFSNGHVFGEGVRREGVRVRVCVPPLVRVHLVRGDRVGNVDVMCEEGGYGYGCIDCIVYDISWCSLWERFGESL